MNIFVVILNFIKMKKLILYSLLIVQTVAFTQQTTLKVVGKNLTLTNGQTIILRGVNYPFIDDGNLDMTNPLSYKSRIDEAAKTGANSIRIMWYTNGTHWRDSAQFGAPGTMSSYVNNGHLNNAIAYCITKNMIPILEIHNITCSNDWTAFNTTVMDFWKSTAIQTLIENNKSKLIINLANEFGIVRWGSNPVNDLLIFKNNYNAAIASLRTLNINVPIMIDAPDCGQSSTEMLSVAESMNNSDSQNNLIFSAHTYWGGYANTLPQIKAKLNEAQSTNVCYILGEVAKNQDNNSCGDLDLSTIYPLILQEACPRNIGWLAWSFSQDCSSARNMTPNGLYTNLTTFGNDIVNNTTYGLKSSGVCRAATLADEQFKIDLTTISVFPNPTTGRFTINTNYNIKNINCLDILGKRVDLQVYKSNFFQINTTGKGVFVLKIELENDFIIYKKIILE